MSQYGARVVACAEAARPGRAEPQPFSLHGKARLLISHVFTALRESASGTLCSKLHGSLARSFMKVQEINGHAIALRKES
jgi:hypothetical protein